MTGDRVDTLKPYNNNNNNNNITVGVSRVVSCVRVVYVYMEVLLLYPVCITRFSVTIGTGKGRVCTTSKVGRATTPKAVVRCA